MCVYMYTIQCACAVSGARSQTAVATNSKLGHSCHCSFFFFHFTMSTHTHTHTGTHTHMQSGGQACSHKGARAHTPSFGRMHCWYIHQPVEDGRSAGSWITISATMTVGGACNRP